MKAMDIMSSPVVVVRPRTAVLRIAASLREYRIGGVPVVVGDELVGIVTEKDLLHRQELGTEYHSQTQSWWRRVVGPDHAPDWYIKSHGRCAEHVMTKNVVVITPETSLRDIMTLFDRHRIGRVPVLASSRLVGIVTCADLVKALAQAGGAAPNLAEGTTSDEGIRQRLLFELDQQDWWNISCCRVDVSGGVVRFEGFVENESQRRASRVAAENVPGVRHVEDKRELLAELQTMF